MATRFDNYAYKEIAARPDRGAGLAARFRFHLNAEEVFGLSKIKIYKKPSLHNLPSTPEVEVRLSELKTGGKIDAKVTAEEIESVGVNRTDYAVKKDLYALFATWGYLCTNFDRRVHVVIRHTDTEQKPGRLLDLNLTADDFADEPHSIKEKALGFYMDMIVEAGEKAGFTEINDETSTRNFGFTVSVVPKAATLQ